MSEITASTDRRGTRRVPLEPVRRAIARTVTESAAMPTFTVTTAADVDRDSIPEISRRTREVAARARDRRLQLADMSDGTFTISNLGMFGIEQFTALIIPPQGAVLAIGSVIEQVTLVEGAPVAHRRLAYTLTADHRIIDGALAARFLTTVTGILEQPDRLRWN